MPKSPQLDSDGVLRLSVKSNGQRIADHISVITVQVNRAANRIASARLVVEDGDMPDGAWPVADDPVFQPGAEISIAAGYGDAGEQPLFKGIVVKLGVEIDGQNCSRLVIDCRHAAVKANLGRNNAHHVDASDGQIIGRLLLAHGLGAKVEATTTTHAMLTQVDCSDWDFVIARAQANGLLVIADDECVAVQTPNTSAEPVLGVSWGTDLIEFKAELDALSPMAEVRAVAWDPARQSIVEGRPAQQRQAGLARIRGRMKFQGSAAARVGSLIEVSGVGARFNGKVFVGAVTHELADGTWFTEVEFGLAPQRPGERGDGVASAAGAPGLLIGVVTRIDGDPAGEQRIQIKLPVLQAAHETVWARLLQPQASHGFGAFFVPEVGDEVVVGFFDHDPSHPVVLGSLYSSARKPPYALEPPNDIKALVTRCGHRLEFDDANQTLTVSTPANNKLVLSDSGKSILLQDQHDNRVRLDASGISIDTPKDLKLSAKGSITIEAVGAVGIGASADLTCSGLNVQCEAAVAFSARGSASAELSAAGQTSVKGAMVMIN